jgi:hypothetical protein
MAYTVRAYTRMSRAAAISMTMPGGQTHEWFRRNVEMPARMEATFLAPFRSRGGLKAGQGSSMGSNQFGLWVALENSAEYAVFVHEGTTGPIWADNGTGMLHLGKQSALGRGMAGILKRPIVSGQEAQPWMADAMSIALRSAGFIGASSAKIRRLA